MDDLLRIIDAMPTANAKDPACAVATVVNTRGSAFRRPGARMLIRRSGKVDGCISAGCLEKDVIAHCQQLNAESEPFLLSYDGRNREDLVFGLHLGCDGLIEVLVEPLSENSLFNQLQAFASQPADMAAATIIDADGAAHLPLGLAFVRQGECSKWKAALPSSILDKLDLQTELSSLQRQSAIVELKVDGMRLQIFAEFVKAIPSLLIIGNGAELQPLTGLARILGWCYTVVDDRKAVVHSSNPPGARESPIELDDVSRSLARLQSQAAVLMTHDYDRDKTILRSLLNCHLSYIGVVGPRKRTDKLLAEMVLDGVSISDTQISRLYSPVGLDIGAERPEEIALSIIAEIQAALAKSQGGFLRDRRGPIHEHCGQEPGLADSIQTATNIPPIRCEL